jgi:signal transduction histidine kinase
MSATARRGGSASSKRWETAAPPVAPDAGRPAAKSRKKKVAQTGEGNVEAVKRRLLRLALDVHDGPMQNLAVIGFSLGDMRRRMRALVPEEHHTKIDSGMEQISAELCRVESELRALITALEHGAIKTIPLLDAIEMEIREFEKHSGLKVELHFDGQARAETDSQRIALQSVTRAALANIAKHAKATTVVIHLSGTPETIRLEIEDDGVGFRPGGAKPGRFGLAGMQERVELLGGDFSMSTRPGGPTKIVAALQTWRPPAE